MKKKILYMYLLEKYEKLITILLLILHLKAELHNFTQSFFNIYRVL